MAPDLDAQCGRIRRTLHALDAVPQGAPWNLPGLSGLLDGQALTPAAVLVGLVPRQTGLHLLLTLRNERLRHHAGQVSFPGGRIEAGDAGPAAAALRETREEVGIPADQITPWGWLDPLATITGFRVQPLVALLAPEIAPVADPGEVAEVFEVPLAHVLERNHLRWNAVTLREQPRQVPEYLPYEGGPRIWGATALILHNLAQRLEAGGVVQGTIPASGRA